MKKIGFIVFLVSLSIQLFGANPKIDRVEPLFWWVGMNNPNLQLMIYGENIASTTPEIKYPGISIKSTTSLTNPNYLFVDLYIDPTTIPGEFNIVFKDAGKVVTEYAYRLHERDYTPSMLRGFDNSDVLYLIMPDRFANGNPENDSQPFMKEKANRENPDGRHGGDLEGIQNHLDYIYDMGYTAIWLNPVLENDQPDFSYHGYAATDFYQVDRRFGSNEEYKALCDAARQKGIKVIMDMIFNHCGHTHWWMDDLPSDDWINNMPDPDYTITNHRKTAVQDPYKSATDYNQLIEGWFVTTMPDLNQRNPFLATYLIQNSIWWIEYVGLSGIRMDTYPYPDRQMMADWTCRVLEEYPYFNIVGEEFHPNPAIVAYWQGGKVNPDGYTSCLPSLMDFPLQDAMSRGLTEEEGWFDGMMRIYETLALDFLYPNPYNLVVFPDNHDMDRVFTRLEEDFDMWRLAMVLTMTTRGIPQIYYGTEILMTGHEHKGHGFIREDFPGGWPGDEINAFTGQGLPEQKIQAQQFLKKLQNWRKKNPVIHTGEMTHFIPENDVYVYFRYNKDQSIMIILNKNSEAQELHVERFKERLAGYTRGFDIISNNEISINSDIIIDGSAAMIIELE